MSKREERERVISYGSRTLSKSETNYCITDKELLAVRHFVEYYKQYLWVVNLWCERITSLAFKAIRPKDRIARWLEILSAYSFEIQHRPCQKHGNVDALSRCVNPSNCQCEDKDNRENLKCGPCKKYLKRMAGMMINTDNINTITSAQHLTRAVQTRTKLKTRETNAILNTENTEWEPVYTHDNINREHLKDTEIATVYRWVEKEKS